MAGAHISCAGSHPGVPVQVWDTAEVDRDDAFDYYREGICSAFMPLRPELDRDLRQGFDARVSSHQIGAGVLNLVSARAHSVLRGRREIAASGSACYYINLQLDGACRIVQQGHEVTLHRNDVGLFDGAEAFDLDHSSFDRLQVASLMVPKDLLRDDLGRLPDGPVKLSADGRYGALVTAAASGLADAVACRPVEETERLLGVVLSLAVLAGSGPGGEVGENRRKAQLFRLRKIVQAQCADPDFAVADCAARAGLSVGYVHNLFAGGQLTFGSELLRERLRLAERGLTDPRLAHLPVAAIAYRAGFKDASHFGRAFRAQYGRSPGDWRRGGGA